MSRVLSPPPLSISLPADHRLAAFTTVWAVAVAGVMSGWGVMKAGEIIAGTPQGAQWLLELDPHAGTGWLAGLPWGWEGAWTLCSQWLFSGVSAAQASALSALLAVVMGAMLARGVWALSLARLPACTLQWNGQSWRVAMPDGLFQPVDLQLRLDLWSGLLVCWAAPGAQAHRGHWRWVRPSQCSESSWHALRLALRARSKSDTQDLTV